MPETQSRRLAAILAADIAGYSALMSADEARTVRDLKAHQSVVLPMIETLGGRIIDTAGDGILAEFPSAESAELTSEQADIRVIDILIVNVGRYVPIFPLANHIGDRSDRVQLV